MTMTEELKPVRCGCGGEANIHMDHKQQYAVWCYVCENHTLWCPKKEMAVAGWNLICERSKVMKPMEGE